ncbi:MAG: sulfotransferase [Deltaproteobacteria bacterium]|nr:sulfotransferase [Deltaproteobacteria bacterium]
MAEAGSLDEAELIAEAVAATGLDDFGGEDFRPGLRALIETYEGHAFDERGRRRNRRRLLGLLTTRLELEAWWKRHPEVLERRIGTPWVLTGLPRSGTSALFNLLSEDPGVRSLRLWEAQFPHPPAGWTEASRGQPDPRHAAVEAHYARGREKNPDFTQIHFASADTPEECVVIQVYAFGGVQHGIEVMMEPYGSWFRAQPQHGVYAIQRKILQLLDWQRPGERWLLKSPAHMWGLDALLDTFPDAGIVWSHRTPIEAIASMCSMIETLMKTRTDLEPAKLGPIVMDFYATSLERGLATRDRLDPARFVDVGHDELVLDPLGVVERIHGRFDRPLGAEVRTAMAAQLAHRPRHHHGVHRYALEKYGLAPDTIRERFAGYVERFGLVWD